MGALEQRVQEMEQQQLEKYIEITNIPWDENENLNTILHKIAAKLKVSIEDVNSVKRQTAKKDRPAIIQVEMKDKNIQTKWLTAAKTIKIASSSIVPNLTASTTDETIFIREALTPYNKSLLWNAKQELKKSYKFIWCKQGIVRVRQNENSKILVIRSIEDIKKLVL